MTNSKHMPKRRFPVFEGEWEEVLLGKLGNAQSGIGFPDSEQGGKVGIPFYKVSDMNNQGNEHEMVFANNYVTIEQINQRSWKPIQDVPAIFFAKVGAAVLLNRKRLCSIPFLMDNNTMAFSIDTSKIDTNFAKTIFETIDLTSLVQVGALPSYNARDVESILVSVPSIPEQEKIGKFFQTIDSLITIQQHKLDKLKNLKKSYLAELFPEEGERVPKRRFPGFEGDWERRKVSELFKITRGYVLAATRTESNKSKTTPYPVYSSQTKDKGLMGFYSNYLYEDAITWTTDGANAGEVNFREGKFYCTNVCGVLLSKEVQADQMIAEAINNIAKKYVSYVGNPKLMNNVMADIEISIPQTSSEREKISQFFTDIDKRISLQQVKLDKLKDLKKAYLNELFV